MLESINDKSSPNHYQLQKSCLTDSKISDIERLFNMKENIYRILITYMFGNDTFINEISVAQEFYYPITTKNVLPTKKQIFPSSSSSNNQQSSSSNIKKSKLKIVSKVPGYKSLEKRMSTKQKSAFIKKAIGTEVTRNIFLKDLKWSSTIDFFGPCYLGNKCIDNNCILIGLNCVRCKKCSIPIGKICSISLDFVIRDNYYCCHDYYFGEQMIGDGYHLQFDDTIKEMLVEFFQIIVRAKSSLSQDYGAKIMYAGKIFSQETMIKDVF